MLFPLLAGYSSVVYEFVWFRIVTLQIGTQSRFHFFSLAFFLIGLTCAPFIFTKLQSSLQYGFLQIIVICELCLLFIGFLSFLILNAFDLIPTYGWFIFGLIFLNGIFIGITHFSFIGYLKHKIHSLEYANALFFIRYNIGCALSSVAFPIFLVPYLGLRVTLVHAILINLSLSLFLYLNREHLQKNTAIESQKSAGPMKLTASLISMIFLSGFLLMTQEAIWLRTTSLVTKSWSISFYLVFAAIFSGFSVGYGAYIFLRKKLWDAKAVTLGSLCLFLLLNQMSQFLLSELSVFHFTFSIIIFYLTIIMGSALFTLATSFTVKMFDGASNATAIYAKFIFLTALGALCSIFVTSSILFQKVSLPQINLILSIILAPILLYFLNQLRNKKRLIFSVSICFLIYTIKTDRYFEKIIFQNRYLTSSKISQLIENGHGIVLVAQDPMKQGDYVLGNGAYDGRFNTDLTINSNGIDRVFKIGTLKLTPHHVLQIGLGSGSWTEILLSNSLVRSLDLIEINPSYQELIRHNTPSKILSDPRLDIYEDDARQWFRKHKPSNKYDLIVMNTTYHWRYGTGNLLSLEFFKLCKEALKTDGVLYLNTTFLKDIPWTLTKNFKYVTTYKSFSAASNHPFPNNKRLMALSVMSFSLLKTPIPDQPEFFLNELFPTIEFQENLQVITDDNLANELKYIW